LFNDFQSRKQSTPTKSFTYKKKTQRDNINEVKSVSNGHHW